MRSWQEMEESLGSWCRQASTFLKQSAPQKAQSLLKVWEERVRAKPHQKIKIKTKNSPIREARGAKV